MSDPIDIKALDEYLKGGSDISQRYRELGREDVPPELDRRVLDAARAAVASGGARALTFVVALERAGRARCFGRAGRDGRDRERRAGRHVVRDQGRATKSAKWRTSDRSRNTSSWRSLRSRSNRNRPRSSLRSLQRSSLKRRLQRRRRRRQRRDSPRPRRSAERRRAEEVRVDARAVRDQSQDSVSGPVESSADRFARCAARSRAAVHRLWRGSAATSLGPQGNRPRGSGEAEADSAADSVSESVVTGNRVRRAAPGRTAGPRNTISGSALSSETAAGRRHAMPSSPIPSSGSKRFATCAAQARSPMPIASGRSSASRFPTSASPTTTSRASSPETRGVV